MGKTRAAGKYVVIKHSKTYTSYFNHMSEIDNSLHVGKNVPAGVRLGAIGCTGYCTLPHLHFAVKKNGRFVDPGPLVRSYPFEYRQLFEQKRIY